mmetsp:Transcript_68718/g.154464  ORF Transcript_68718/g.154464 Transcript_68718/m.154464 type:complete len:548 (-) Transcript_68718:29-1672(-)
MLSSASQLAAGARSAASSAAGAASSAAGLGNKSRVAPAPEVVGAESDPEAKAEAVEIEVPAAGSKASASGSTAGGIAASAAGWASQAAAGAQRAKEIAAPVATDLASKAAGAANIAAPVAKEAAGKAAGIAADVGQASAAKAREAAQAGLNVAVSAKERAVKLKAELKRILEAWVKRRVQAIAERMVDKAPGIVKTRLDDPDMPRLVAHGKDRLIDAVWVDVREEVLWEVAVLLDKQTDDPALQDEASGIDCIRAFFRYHMFPFDKGFWGKLRDPWFVLIKLIAAVPLAGVSPLMFLWVFLMIDKGDEFQLIQFILSFKGMQFLSQGIIRVGQGYYLYLACVTAPAREGSHECDDSGPGSHDVMGLMALVGFLLTQLLVWVAFALMPCSTQKGRSTLQGSITQEHTHRKGGYIRYFLWWDLLALLLCIGPVIIWAVASPPIKHSDKAPRIDDWPIEHAVYAASIVYGLLSVPFFFFTLPGLQRILTGALPTAYDRQGRCRQPQKPKKVKESRSKLPSLRGLVSEVEALEILKKLKGATGLQKASDTA